MQIDANFVAFFSILVTGITVIVSPIASAVTARVRWQREQHVAQQRALEAASTALVLLLAEYRTAALASFPGYTATRGTLIGRFYVWQQTIWPHLAPADRARLAALQSALEIRGDLPTAIPDLLVEINALHQVAAARIK